MINFDRAKIIIGMGNTLFFSGIAANGAWERGILFYIATLFFVVGTTSSCRRRENMWLFLLNIIGSIPINIALTRQIMQLGIFDSGFPVIGAIIACLEIYLILLSFEQLLIAIIGRIIWKKQELF